MVRVTGFEPATFRTQTGRSSQAELHPYNLVEKTGNAPVHPGLQDQVLLL
jgi:hypothetical protein